MKIIIEGTEYILPYVVKRPSGYYWQPKPGYKKHGFGIERLPDKLVDMIAAANQLNEKLTKARLSGFVETGGAEYGSLSHAIALYRESRVYKNLSPITRRNYEGRLKRFEAKLGPKKITNFVREEVVRLYETLLGSGEEKQPRKAQDYIKVLSNIIQCAIDNGIYKDRYGNTMSNPCLRLRMEHNPSRTFIPTDDHINNFISKADELGETQMGTAVRLAYDLCQRETDVIELKWENFDGTHFTIVQSKTGAKVEVECLPELKKALLAIKRHTPYIVAYKDKYQKKYTNYKRDWFVCMFIWIRREAKLPEDFQFRDLRGAGMTRLAEAGCNAQQMAAISGHSIVKCQRILDVYIRKTRTLADQGIAKVKEKQKKDREFSDSMLGNPQGAVSDEYENDGALN